MVLTTSNPFCAVKAPAQASAEYQPIELPVTAKISTSVIAAKSEIVAA